jgi:hypothetical protein
MTMIHGRVVSVSMIVFGLFARAKVLPRSHSDVPHMYAYRCTTQCVECVICTPPGAAARTACHIIDDTLTPAAPRAVRCWRCFHCTIPHVKTKRHVLFLCGRIRCRYTIPHDAIIRARCHTMLHCASTRRGRAASTRGRCRGRCEASGEARPRAARGRRGAAGPGCRSPARSGPGRASTPGAAPRASRHHNPYRSQ